MKFNEKQQNAFDNFISKSKKYLKDGNKAEVDLHVHSIYSDGLFSIEQLIYMAKQINLKVIAITDHNTILNGYNELLNIAKENNELLNGIKIILGCEVACKYFDVVTGNYIPIEILAYGPNPKKLQKFLDNNMPPKQDQSEQLEILKKIAIKEGLKVSNNLALPNNMYATEAIARDLMSYEENKDYFLKFENNVWNEPKLFYKQVVSNPNSPFFIDTTINFPLATDVIENIYLCGGYPSLAHPFLYNVKTKESVERMIFSLISTTELNCIEVKHSSHTLEERKILENFAKKHNLNVSGGSDFHQGPRTILGFGDENKLVSLRKDMFPWLNKVKKT